MAQRVLRFVAVAGENGGPMVPDYDAQRAGQRRYVGRYLDPNRGQPFIDADSNVPMRHAAFVAHAHDALHPETKAPLAVHEVATTSRHAGEYLRHLRGGDLLPFDAFTAQTAGVPFDPTLSGAAMFVVDEPEEKAPDPVAAIAAVLAARKPSAPKPSTASTLPAPPASLADPKVTL